MSNRRMPVRAQIREMCKVDSELRRAVADYDREFYGHMRYTLETAGLKVEPYIQEIKDRQANHNREPICFEALREAAA